MLVLLQLTNLNEDTIIFNARHIISVEKCQTMSHNSGGKIVTATAVKTVDNNVHYVKDSVDDIVYKLSRILDSSDYRCVQVGGNSATLNY